MIELRPLGQISTPPPMVPFVDRLKRNYERTVKTLMKATPRSLDSMLRSADQILSNEATLRARARSVRELRNLPEHEKTAALRGYYEAIKRAIAVIKPGGATIPARPIWAPSPTTPAPPALTTPPWYVSPIEAEPIYAKPAFPDLPPAPPSYAPVLFEPPAFTPPQYVSPIEAEPIYAKPAFPDLPPAPPSYAPVLFEPPPEPPPFTIPALPDLTPPPGYASPVEPVTPPGAIKLLKMPDVPYSEKFKQILSDAIKAAFRTLNLGAPRGAPGVELSKPKLGHIINVTYEVANKAGRADGYKYSTRLIRDALQWRHITAQGQPAQLPQFDVLSPYALNAAAIAPVPIMPPTSRPTPPEPAFPVTVPGLTPVGPPAKIMDARFLEILNKHMDYFLKGQRYTIRPKYVWYIPRHMMERFVKEIGDASNREGGKYGYTYDKGLVWDALQLRGYEPSTNPDGTKRTPYDKQVQPSPYDRPGSSVPPAAGQVIPPMAPPPTEIPDMPTQPTAPSPPTEREETYSERMKRKLREAKASREAIEKERKRAREEKKAKRKEEIERKREARKARQTDILPPLTQAQWIIFQDMLNRAIDNRLQVAEWPTLPGRIISIPDADYEKLIASIQTFANMMARTKRGVYYSFSSAEVGDALASRGYVRGTDIRPASGPGASPLPVKVVVFSDYNWLINTIKQKLRSTSLSHLVITPALNRPLPIRYIKPAPGETKGCFDTMQRAIRQILVRRRWEVRPPLEKIISPAAHAGFVHQVREYANSQYPVNVGTCPPFTESYTRDAVIKAGILPHPEGTNVPTTPMNIGASARTEENWKQRGQAIYPWEVHTHFPAHFPSTRPTYPQ